MERMDALRALNELASDQAGLVTAAQASSAGVDHLTQYRLVEAGFLERVGRGVYQVGGAQSPDYLGIRVAWLRLDPRTPAWKRKGLGVSDGVVSHRSATVIHGLGDIPAHDVELSVPRRRTTREPGVRLLTRSDLTERDVSFVSGLPVTTPERTILDLLHDHADGGHVGRVIADADRRDLVDIDKLGPRADGLGVRYGMPDASGRELLSELVSMLDRQLTTDRVLEASDAAARLGYVAGVESIVEQMAKSGVLDSLTRFPTISPAVLEAVHGTGFQTILEQISKVAVNEALRAVAPSPELLLVLQATAAAQVAAVQNLGMSPEILRLAAASVDALRRTALPPDIVGNIAKIAAIHADGEHLYEVLTAALATDSLCYEEPPMSEASAGHRDAATRNVSHGDEANHQLAAATSVEPPQEVQA